MSSAQNSVSVLYVMTLRYNKKVSNQMSKIDVSKTGSLPVNFKYYVLILSKLLFIFPLFIIINVYIYCL
jgi:hypothetical protein